MNTNGTNDNDLVNAHRRIDELERELLHFQQQMVRDAEFTQSYEEGLREERDNLQRAYDRLYTYIQSSIQSGCKCYMCKEAQEVLKG